MAANMIERYDKEGIVGLLEKCKSIHDDEMNCIDFHVLVRSIIKAPGSNKGKAASVLNALVGSCCGEERPTAERAEVALNLVQAWDSVVEVKPDVVGLSLAFTALKDHHPKEAAKVLARAVNRNSPACPAESNHRPLISDWKRQIEKKHGIQVLHDDPGFLIINKPSGMVCFHSPSQATKLARPRDPSLIDLLVDYGLELSNLNPDSSRGLVHRLDLGTSGCMVVAKSNEVHAQLLTKFFLRRARKSYQALVYVRPTVCAVGDWGVESIGTINIPVEGRPAVSNYRVLHRYGSLVRRLEVVTFQGRRHQVRIHCSKGLGQPILLDPLYGGEAIMFHYESKFLRECRANRKLCLHAASLSIPDFGVMVEAEIPDWWQHLIHEIERHSS